MSSKLIGLIAHVGKPGAATLVKTLSATAGSGGGPTSRGLSHRTARQVRSATGGRRTQASRA